MAAKEHDPVAQCFSRTRRLLSVIFVLVVLFALVLFTSNSNFLMATANSLKFRPDKMKTFAGTFYDRSVMLTENTSIFNFVNATGFVTKALASTTPATLKATNYQSQSEIEKRLWAAQGLPDPCATPRRSTGVQDILCLEPPKFLPNFKNPCWYEGQLLRCLPYFHLMGVCKSGTSDFFKRLFLHPDIIPNLGIFGKEIWFWSWERLQLKTVGNIPKAKMTLRDFTNKFQANQIAAIVRNMSGYKEYHPAITGHGDPMDFWDRFGWYNTPQNDPTADEPLWTTPFSVRHIDPDVKLILMIRDPVERLYSHFFHGGFGKTSAAFTTNVEQSLKVWENCIQKRSIRACAYDKRVSKSMLAPIYTSLYSVHLKEWLRAFPKNQLLVFRNEDYVRDIKGTMKMVFNYLQIDQPSDDVLNRMQQLPPFYATKSKAKAGPMNPETRKMLKKFYRPYMEEFAKILGDDKFLWNDVQ